MLQNEQTEPERHKAPVYSCCVAPLIFGRLFLFPNAPYGASGALHTPKEYVLFGVPKSRMALWGRGATKQKV